MFKAVVALLLAGALHADPLAYGTFTVVDRSSQNVIAAPHGGFDLESDSVALAVAQEIGWSVVAASGFRSRQHPINVNRPTEGIGLGSEKETHSQDAREVFDAYRGCVLRLAQMPRFYVEIHGEGRSENRVEVATVGVTVEDANRIKALLTQALAPEYEVAVEGVDPITFKAGAAKKFGLLHEVSRALHIELPWRLRNGDAQKAIRALSQVLPQAGG